MKNFGKLSRRQFLSRSLTVGLTGTAACFAASSDKSQLSKSKGQTAWQIGCFTRPWADYDYRVAFDAIAEAGFKYVGLMTTKSETKLVISVATSDEEAQQVGEEARKRGLTVAAVYGGNPPVKESLQVCIDGLKKLIDNCAACDGKNLMLSGTNKKEYYEMYYKAIAECCDYAEAKGIGIGIKPHGKLNGTGTQCRKTIEMVGHKNFRLWYDPGNILYYSEGKLNPIDDAATVDGLLVGMCVKDYQPPRNVSLTPGAGIVDFPAVFSRLKQGGFTSGPLIIESLEPGDLKQTLAEAKKARGFVEQLTQQILL